MHPIYTDAIEPGQSNIVASGKAHILLLFFNFV